MFNSYDWNDCPRLMFDGRMYRSWHKGIYRVRQNTIALKTEKHCWKKWDEHEFLITYLHELAHWATWLGASPKERRQMLYSYNTISKTLSHDKRLIEKIAYWVSGTF
jgi:hypothetical protein